MSVLASFLALQLLLPLGQVSSRDKAESYYRQGQENFRRERYDAALKSFEMAIMHQRFAWGDESTTGEAMHFATVAAVRAGLGKPALQHAKDYVAWAEGRGIAREIARARNDLVAALIASDHADEARSALKRAADAVARAHDADESRRLADLEAQLEALAPGSGLGAPGAAPRAAPRSGAADAGGAAVVTREVETIDLSGSGDEDEGDGDVQPDAGGAESAVAPSRPSHSAPPPATLAPTAAGEAPMVLIPAGEFTMGDAQGKPDEQPPHRVKVRAFLLDRHEVSNREFASFVAATGYVPQGNYREHAGPGTDDLPVRGVTWSDAEAYARHARKRLPTEAEWERAARGPQGLRYSFGDTFAPTAARVGLAVTAGPAAVESHAANAFGVHDLTGNVIEWCADWYVPSAYSSTTPEPAADSERRNLRVLRGGAWDADATGARNASRTGLPPGRSLPFVGFRCARDASD